MPIRALILIRISSTKQQHGQSLESQETRGINFAIQECGVKREEVKVFYEVCTGAKHNRPDFERMMAFAEKQASTVEKVIITDIDRFTRAGVPFYEEAKMRLARLGIQLIDVFGVIQPPRNHLQGTGEGFGEDLKYEWSFFSPSEGEEFRRAQESKSERRNILIRTIPKLVENIKNGYEARKVNYGYTNIKLIDSKTGRRIATCKPHPVEAPFIVKMYQLRAVNISDLEASKQLNKDGYLSRSFRKWKTNEKGQKVCIGLGGQRPLTPYQIKENIKNPRYAGFKCEKWTWGKLVKARHKPLVSIELWNKANHGKFIIVPDPDNKGKHLLIDIKQDARRYVQQNPDFPHKYVVRCPECQSKLKGAYFRGKSGKQFPLYYCNRKHKQVSINPKELKRILSEEIKKIKFFGETAPIFKDSFKHLLKAETEFAQHTQEQRENKLVELRLKLNSLVKSLEHITFPELIRETERSYLNLKNQIALLEAEKVDESGLSPAKINRILEFCQKLVKHPAKFLLSPDNHRVVEPLWSMMFEQAPTIKNIKERTLKWSLPICYFEDPSNTISKMVSQRHVKSNHLYKELIRWLECIEQINRIQDIDSSE